MKYKLCLLGLFSLIVSNFANAYVFVSAVPTSVRLVDGGLVLIGDFDLSTVACSTGPSAIYLPGSDIKFDQKLSLALTAFAAGKTIEVLISDPVSQSCVAVSAIGNIPTAYHNYWYLN